MLTLLDALKDGILAASMVLAYGKIYLLVISFPFRDCLNAPNFFEVVNMPSNKYHLCDCILEIHYSVLEYDFLNLEIPTVPLLGKLAMAGIQVLIYRYKIQFDVNDTIFLLLIPL